MASQAVARRPFIPKVHPPSSPFGELLRRSNFASYDPAIRQTYTAPASYVHRGNWGLKRPIANRKRHSSIVLRNFEEHAHYIEWDKAPAQVDFIKRVEELNIQPTLEPNTPWSLSLGPSADVIDSDFSPHNWKPRKKEDTEEHSTEPKTAPRPDMPSPNSNAGRKSRGVPIDLTKFGNRGPGGYGENRLDGPRGDGTESSIQPNIAAMTPDQFEKYLEELRSLRSEFKKYVKESLVRRRGKDDPNTIKPNDLGDEEIILNLGAEATEKSLHRYFLGKHAKEKFTSYKDVATRDLTPAAAEAAANVPQPIQGQPHRLGGLVYSKPTMLETYYSGRAEPGIILQTISPGANSSFHRSRDNGYIAAFAGVSARLHKDVAGTGVTPLFNPFSEEGLNAPLVPNESGTGSSVDMQQSVRDMRMVELKLQAPPKVVGQDVPNLSMLDVRVDANVVVNQAIDQNSRYNPHKPGSRAFNSVVNPNQGSSPRALPGWATEGRSHRHSLRNVFKTSSPPVGVARNAETTPHETTDTIALLMNLTGKPKPPADQ